MLLVARDFPAYANSPGGILRVLKLAEFLADRGYEVHVVAAAGTPLSDLGYESTLAQLRTHYVPDRYQRYRTRKWRNTMETSEQRCAGWGLAFSGFLSPTSRPGR